MTKKKVAYSSYEALGKAYMDMLALVQAIYEKGEDNLWDYSARLSPEEYQLFHDCLTEGVDEDDPDDLPLLGYGDEDEVVELLKTHFPYLGPYEVIAGYYKLVESPNLWSVCVENFPWDEVKSFEEFLKDLEDQDFKVISHSFVKSEWVDEHVWIDLGDIYR